MPFLLRTKNEAVGSREVRDEMQTLLDALYEGVYFVDVERHITRVNAAAQRITGHTAIELLGRPSSESILAPPEAMAAGADGDLETFVQHKKGMQLAITLRVAPLLNAHGEITGAIEIFQKRDAGHAAGQRAGEVPHTGHRDALTGLDDHCYTELRLHDELKRFKEHRQPFGVLLVEIDEFAARRGHYGHEAGQAITRVVASSLTENVSAFDFVGQWEGPRFLVVVDDIDEAEVHHSAERLRLAISSATVEWWGTAMPLSVSIGATGIRPGDAIDQVLQRVTANLALSKDQGGNRATCL